MLEALKRKFNLDIYRGWEKGKKYFRTRLTSGYPSKIMNYNDRGYVCDERRRSVCKVYCCSDHPSVASWLNPLEAIIISHKTSNAPEDFLNPSEPHTSITFKEETEVTTPFLIKTDNGYCTFNNMPDSDDCNIYYNSRPLTCRVHPFVFIEPNILRQRKSCPGFKKGNILDKSEIRNIKIMGKVSSLLEDVYFDISEQNFERHDGQKIAEYVWKSMDINPEQIVETLGKGDFHEYVERMKEISNFEEELESRKIEQNLFEKYILKIHKV